MEVYLKYRTEILLVLRLFKTRKRFVIKFFADKKYKCLQNGNNGQISQHKLSVCDTTNKTLSSYNNKIGLVAYGPND